MSLNQISIQLNKTTNNLNTHVDVVLGGQTLAWNT